MFPLVLALAAAQSDPITELMDGEHAKLAPAECSGAATCAPPLSYRVDGDGGSGDAITSKDRAFAEDGSYCNVIGDKYCVSQPRLRLHAGLPAGGDGGYVRMAPLVKRH